MKTLRAFLLFLFLPALCFAQGAKKIPVKVGHDGNDQVGKSVVFALKEAIRGSQSFFLVEDLKRPAISVTLLSVDVDDPDKGIRSSMTVIVVYDSMTTPGAGIFLNAVGLMCGRNIAERCAKDILPIIDRGVQFLRTNQPDLWKQL